MPIERVGRHKTEKYVVRNPEEAKIIEKAVYKFRGENHDVHDFIKEFFGVISSNPSDYLERVKRGETAISKESWDKTVGYVSKPSGK